MSIFIAEALIDCIKYTLIIEAAKEINRSMNTLHIFDGYRNNAEIKYNPGNVVIFGSHCKNTLV